MKYVLPIFLILTISGCKEHKNDGDYLPDGSFYNTEEQERKEKRLAKFWEAFGENPIWKLAQDPKEEIYRFTHLRSFHNPICVRIEKRNNRYLIEGTVTSGAGGYDPGVIEIHEKKYLGESDFQDFLRVYESANPQGFNRLSGNRGTDGATWVLEIVRGGEYFFMCYHGQYEGEPIKPIADWMYNSLDWNLKEEEYY
jgi:hypothetical protein